MLNKKLKAFLIHFLVSAVVVSLFISFALFVWYPTPYLQTSGLLPIVLILVSVDLVLGPLLTLVIYKEKKPRLKLDLACIATVKIAALAYGMLTIYQGHPVYVAYSVDRFTLITAQEVDPQQAKHPEHRISKLGRPLLVYAQIPDDPDLQKKLMFETLGGRPDIDARPEYYEPINQNFDKILQNHELPLSIAKKHQAKLKKLLDKRNNKNINNYSFIPLIGKGKAVYWAWDKSTKEPVGVLEVSLWQS